MNKTSFVLPLLLAMSVRVPAMATTINVQDYGAQGNDSSDDTAAINSAINDIPGSGATLYFPCGTYIISSALTPIQISNVTVAGPSSNCVTIKAGGAHSYIALQVGNQNGFSTGIKLVADSRAGSNTFRVQSGGLNALGIGVGDYVLIQNTAWASNGPGSPLVASQQVVVVTAVSGDMATIAGTFSQDFVAGGCDSPPSGECGGFIQTFTPVANAVVQYITIDGSTNAASNSIGIDMNIAVNSTISSVNVNNFLGSGASGGIIVDTGYNNKIQNVNCSRVGNGGSAGNDGITVRRQTNANVQNVTITQSSSQTVFSFSLRETHFSTVTNLTVDAKGAVGRPFKFLRASHNTINSANIQNGGGTYNGISVTDISAHNTFNNCVILNNSGKGIAMFGNGNSYNTFNNCVVKYSTQGQFGAVPDYWGNFGDSNITLNDGVYCCSRSNGLSALIDISNAPAFTMSGVTITDDQGQAQNGLTLGTNDAVVQNNSFANLPDGHDIYATGSVLADSFCGNVTPDGVTPRISQPICGGPVDTSNVQSYGAAGDGSTDDTAALNRAILALPNTGGTLYFPCGTYLVSGPLTPISMNLTAVLGPSPTCVTIKATGSASFTVLQMSGLGLSQTRALRYDATSNTFTTNPGGLASIGITVGSIVLVQDNPSGNNGVPDQQTVKVTSVNGDTATIEGSFATDFTVSSGSYVQALVNPIIGTIQNVLIDGSQNTGSSSQGVALVNAWASIISNVQVQNFRGRGTGSTCLIADTGYNNHIYNDTLVNCGSGGTAGLESISLRRQTKALVKNLDITNSSSQAVIGLGLRQTHFSNLPSNSVDNGNANGSPFFMMRSSYNTIGDLTANNGGGTQNGIGISDSSTNNTFTNCVALSNNGAGIALYGDGNQYNTFNNCTAKYNTLVQFGQFTDSYGNYSDDYTVVNGGTFCYARNNGASIINLVSNYATLSGAYVGDDQGLAQNGLTISGSDALIQNNSFHNLPDTHNIYVKNGLNSDTFCGNSTPGGNTPTVPSGNCH